MPQRWSRADIDAIASTQRGLVLVEQLVTLGCSRRTVQRMVQRRELIRVRRGLLRSAAAPVTFEQRALAAVLGVPPVVAVGGLAAAYLWGLRPSAPHRVRIVGDRRLADSLLPCAGIVVRSDLTERDVTRRGGIPVTSIQWTIADLAAELSRGDLHELVDRAISTRRVHLGALQDQLERRRSRRTPGATGAKALHAALEPWRSKPEMRSVAEAALARHIAAAGLPAPVAGHLLGHRREGRPIHVDFAWPRARVALELDGFAYHSSPRQFGIDRDRDLEALLIGWTVVRVSAEQVLSEPARVCRALERALTSAARAG